MPEANKRPQTLYDKVLQAHIVDERLDGTILLYIGMYSQSLRYLFSQARAKLTVR